MVITLKDLIKIIKDTQLVHIVINDVYVGQFSACIISEYMKESILNATVDQLAGGSDFMYIFLKSEIEEPQKHNDKPDLFSYFHDITK